MLRKLLCLLFIVGSNYCFSQEQVTGSLSIGDKVPDMAFKMANYPYPATKFSQFRNKFIILDFWATTCTSCILKFPKLDSLQKKYKGQLQVLLVNSSDSGDDEGKINALFTKWKAKYGKNLSLPSVIKDDMLKKAFPHQLIPHYVWISADGTVQAITAAEEATEENIQAFLKGEMMDLPVKMDIDIEKPLFVGEHFPEKKMQAYSMFIKGKVAGLPSGNTKRKNGNIVHGEAFTNKPILSMYNLLAGRLLPGFNEKRLILEIRDFSKLFLEKSDLSKVKWDKENLYSIDLIVPLKEAGRLNEYMLEDLNRYSDYYGKIEKRKIKCLVLTRTSDTDKIQSKGSKPQNNLNDKEKRLLINLPLLRLTSALNRSLELLVLDETGYTGNVDLEIFADLNDLPSLRKELQRYDLDLVERERELEIFVLKEKEGKKVLTSTHP